MIEIGAMTEYDAELAESMGKLLTDLSTHYDGEAVSRERLEEIIESPWHDILLAFDDEKLVAIASVSVIMGALVGRNEYLEDFVVAKDYQGQGVGAQMWDKIVEWGKAKGCRRLEFTSSGKGKKIGAVRFYQKHGAEIRDTNSFRFEL